jgi:hypothetical protein
MTMKSAGHLPEGAMKHWAAAGLLIGLLGGCIPGPKTAEEARVAAARADSSAAGYEVGRPQSTAQSGAEAGGSTFPAPRSSSQTIEPDPIQPTVPMPVQTDPSTLPIAAAVARETTITRSPRVVGLAPLDPEREKDFLTSDSERKTAVFHLTAGVELGDRVSFNAATRGARILTIPVGWRLRVIFVNQDPELPHSAVVTPSVNPVPEELPLPAFAGARTVKLDEGLLEGDSDEIAFNADRVGRYLLACGVMAHAQRGQWLTLVISDTITIPSYR